VAAVATTTVDLRLKASPLVAFSTLLRVLVRDTGDGLFNRILDNFVFF